MNNSYMHISLNFYIFILKIVKEGYLFIIGLNNY